MVLYSDYGPLLATKTRISCNLITITIVKENCMKYRITDISAPISLESLTHRMSIQQLLASEHVIIRYAI